MGDELFELRHQPDWRTRQRRDVESALSGSDNVGWVAEMDGVVVGFVAATTHPDEALGEILMLAVDPRSQGQGIGTQLTEIATDWIRDSGMAVAFVSTGGENTGHDAAHATYERAGYRRLPIAYYLKALRT